MTTVQAVHKATGSLGNRGLADWFRDAIAKSIRLSRRNKVHRRKLRVLVKRNAQFIPLRRPQAS